MSKNPTEENAKSIYTTGLGSRLRAIQQEHTGSQKEFADKVGTSAANVSNYLTGKTEPPTSFIASVLKVFPEISASWLLHGIGTMHRAERKEKNPIKVVTVSIEEGSVEIDCTGEVIYAGPLFYGKDGTKNVRAYAVSTDAMEGRISKGDYVFIDLDANDTHEGVYLLRLGDTIALREMSVAGPDKILLAATNPRYPDIYVSHDDIEIIGKVVGAASLVI